jgi:hypothetical protein
MSIELMHLLLREEGIPERRIEALEMEKFGVTLRQLAKAGIYQPKLQMEGEAGDKDNLLDLLDDPSERFKSLTHDEARMLHIPEHLKQAVFESLRAVKNQPHLPYRYFCEFVRTSAESKRYPSRVKTQLRSMLSQEKGGAFASVCLDCEAVIGLHKAPAGIDIPHFIAVLTTIGAQSGWTCPECDSSHWAFMKSGALNTGYPLDRLIPPELREMGF